jgi:hypothetical protein
MLVEITGQLRRIVCDHHTGRETFCRSELVVVAHLAEIGPARHNDDRSRARERRDDRTHAGMRDDERSSFEQFMCAIDREKRFRAEVLRPISARTRLADLAEHWHIRVVRRPRIDRADEAIEWQLRTDRQKNHSTEPS